MKSFKCLKNNSVCIVTKIIFTKPYLFIQCMFTTEKVFFSYGKKDQVNTKYVIECLRFLNIVYKLSIGSSISFNQTQ